MTTTNHLPHRINWQIAYFTLVRTVMNSGYRMTYPLLPLFASGMGVDLAAFATAFSVRSFLGIIAPFLAAFADTRGRKAGMLLGMGIFTLGCGIVAIWPGFLTFVIASTLVVIGNGVFIPSMQAYLGDHVPFEKRGAVLSITELGAGFYHRCACFGCAANHNKLVGAFYPAGGAEPGIGWRAGQGGAIRQSAPGKQRANAQKPQDGGKILAGDRRVIDGDRFCRRQ